MSDLKELAVHLVELARSEGAKDVVAQGVSQILSRCASRIAR